MILNAASVSPNLNYINMPNQDVSFQIRNSNLKTSQWSTSILTYSGPEQA